MLNSNNNEKALKNENRDMISVSIEDLDNQFEFYNKTLNEFEKLNHNNILKLNKLLADINVIKKENEAIKKDVNFLREENDYYKLLLSTKVYKFPNFLRGLIDKIKLFFQGN